MLMAHPVVLRNLLEEYASLELLQAREGSPEVRRRVDDVVYTLCVSTGTSDVVSALTVARQHVAAASPGDAAVPAATVSAPLIDADAPLVDAGAPAMEAGAPALDAAAPDADGPVAVG